jgi:hypothetical protein
MPAKRNENIKTSTKRRTGYNVQIEQDTVDTY